MTKEREALKMALEALENSIDIVRNEYETDWRHGLPTRLAQLASMKAEIEAHEQAITECKEALTQPPPPPPECKTEAEKIAYSFGWWKALEYVRTEQLVQRTWVGLTDDEVYKIAFALEGEHWRKIADAIEAKLKEKNFD